MTELNPSKQFFKNRKWISYSTTIFIQLLAALDCMVNKMVLNINVRHT